MNYELLKNIIDLVQEFEEENAQSLKYQNDVKGFQEWITDRETNKPEPQWEGKELGRSAESVINTLIVHMNRYAKSYSKSVIHDSEFSTQEDFIYLINLKAFGAMSKMELIKKNIQEKPAGMQIINRLIANGWVTQTTSEKDKRCKVISMTAAGEKILQEHMDKIRKATQIVTGNLNDTEKMELIRLLTALNDFHLPLYQKNIPPELLLEEAIKTSEKKEEKE